MGATERTPLLRSGDGLALLPADDGCWRLAWGEADWLGPVGLGLGGGPRPRAAELARARPFEGEDALGRFEGHVLTWRSLDAPLRTTVRAYAERPVIVFRLEATDRIEGLATGSFASPAFAWPWLRPAERRQGAGPAGLRGFGHQYTEFAFPTLSGPDLDDFFLFPHRPAALLPLWLNAADGRSLLLAPLDAFHEQIVAVPSPGAPAAPGLRCGWHGDLDAVPPGFATELAVWAGGGPRRVAEAWAHHLRAVHGTRRPSRHHDATVSRLSYWTDNGAAYWYRTEPGLDMAATLEAAMRSFAEARIPVAAVELDSWFYPHEIPRAVSHETPEHVPPSGALRWEPREDVLPEGIEALRERLGSPPLVVHARHWSSRSPCFDAEPAWRDGDRAHPIDPGFFARLLDRAAEWGVLTVEQDWLVEMFLGVRGLREAPGRARAWQEALDRAAGERGMSLIWCMATPADLLATVHLGRVVGVRTCGDYRYLADNPANWVRFLYTNALARALGLHPFKDVFLSNPAGAGLDGDPHAEAEALLSALSAGPVGLGDRAGRSDREVVMRTCREDGVLVKPDVPLAAIERCLRRDCYFEPELLVAECVSEHAAGRFVYVAAFNAWRGRETLSLDLPLAELGEVAPADAAIALDWRSGDCALLRPGDALGFRLEPGDWSLQVLCPVNAGRLAVLGDLRRYACASDTRIAALRFAGDAIECELVGAPGESLELSGWSAGPVRAGALASGADARIRPDAMGRFAVPLRLGAEGRTALRLRPDGPAVR